MAVEENRKWHWLLDVRTVLYFTNITLCILFGISQNWIWLVLLMVAVAVREAAGFLYDRKNPPKKDARV